jgi:hypothetical protein
MSDLFPHASEEFKRLNPSLFGPAAAPVATKMDAADLQAITDVCDKVEASPLERTLQDLCEKELNRRGIWFLHLSPRAREKEGAPDLMFTHPITHRFCGVELKSKTGEPSPEQIKTLVQLHSNGAMTGLFRSFPQFLSFLNSAE